MNKVIAAILGVGALWFTACKEEPPYINYEPQYVTSETTYVDVNVPVPQPREVLIEDMSGVQCINCPDGAKVIRDLKANNPGRVNAITNYPKDYLKSLTDPLNKPSEGVISKYDFRTIAGKTMIDNLGGTNAMPFGYIDRNKFVGANRYFDRTQWVAKFNAEKDSVTPVNITLAALYTSDNDLSVEMKLNFTTDLSGDYYVSIALLQDRIIDYQEYLDTVVGAAYDPNYAHMHVLRKMFTASMGDKINNEKTTLERGRVVVKRYTITLEDPANTPPFPPYDKKNLAVIAFVHRAIDGVVVQSKEIEVHE